ncbi:MAG: DUF3990 domain-containing protein [Lachnospiraceae bacterium]|nr:DUF3990 domain-containing protein [Lachnospiraceae bacterium]
MEYQVYQDLESIIEILEITQEELARDIGVSRVTVNNWHSGKAAMNDSNIKLLYEYAFQKGIRLNKIKEQFYIEDYIKEGEILLFHGSKKGIEGRIDVCHSKRINDFGKGFYCGESLEQSAMFVATYPDSSLYMLKFNGEGLNKRVFYVDRDWMLMVAYFRGGLKEYENSEVIKQLIEANAGIDYIVAPIADNRMFEIIDSFIDGEITDVQCRHCLSATNLGSQYVFITQKAVDRITLLEKCYLAGAEKEFYLTSRQEGFKMNQDKVKLARKQYRNQGKYIEDILK